MTTSNDEAFGRYLEPHRRALTAHCYRMLGSLSDAEEATQEALIRGWQRLDELREVRAARAWLYRIATHACLDRLKQHRRRRRVQPHLVAPAANPELSIGPADASHAWIEPAPDSLFEPAEAEELQPDAQLSMRESISLAFITALQLLPPKQRAALLLMDVLGFRPAEIAGLLKASEDSVHSLLQRARKNLHGASPAVAPPSAQDEQEALRRYIALWQTGDIEAFAELLAHDAVVSMPPELAWYTGHANIRRFFERVRGVSRDYHFAPVRANGAPAVAVYVRRAGEADYVATAITVLCLRGRLISQVTRFAASHLFSCFGLPERTPGGGT